MTASRDSYPIPGTLNVALALGASGTCAALLFGASHAASWPGRLGYAVAFSFVANTVFSLLHEAVHRTLHRNRLVNEAVGMVAAALFPTSLTFQRICHLGHHRRNRTDAEMFEMYGPGDNRFLKALQMYGILTGFYWTLAPLGCVLFLVAPGLFALPKRATAVEVRQTGLAAMLSGFEGDIPGARIRLEVLFAAAFQALLFLALGLTFAGWLTCYWAFALNWGALQYADHAWTIRDIRNGAWNLRVNPIVRALFLNYHHHLAHHQHPNVPWIHLGRLVDEAAPRPRFLSIYLRMWKGPTPATEPPPSRIEPGFAAVLDAQR